MLQSNGTLVSLRINSVPYSSRTPLTPPQKMGLEKWWAQLYQNSLLNIST